MIGSADTAYGQAGQSYGQASAGLGQVWQYLSKADGYFGQAAGLATPQDFYGAEGVSKYMNTYTQSVIDTTMATARQNDAAQTASVVGNAIGSGAYGGDRNGIAVAALSGQQDMANNSTIAGLNQANYSQATAQFNATQAQRQAGAGIYTNLGQGELQAGDTQLNDALGYAQVGAGQNANAAGYAGLGSLYATQGQGYAGFGTLQGQTAQEYGSLASTATGIGTAYNSTGQLGLGTAGLYNSLGTLQGTTGQALGTLGGQASTLGQANQSTLISGASAGLQGATLEQQNAQQQDTAAYNQYMAGLSYPYQNVGFLSNIVQGIGSQEGNTSTTQGNALSSIAGLGTSSIGILGATGAFGANGYLSSIGSTFSDERVKENIATVGTTHDGQPIYRYNYKGTDPRDVKMGLMAQDVEQRDPGAVGNTGGVKTVDYGRATADAARMGLGAVGQYAATQGADLASRMPGPKRTGRPMASCWRSAGRGRRVASETTGRTSHWSRPKSATTRPRRLRCLFNKPGEAGKLGPYPGEHMPTGRYWYGAQHTIEVLRRMALGGLPDVRRDEILQAYDAWIAAGAAEGERSGLTTAREQVDASVAENAALRARICMLPARTPAGVDLKLRVVLWLHDGLAGLEAELRPEEVESPEFSASIALSLVLDLERQRRGAVPSAESVQIASAA